MNPESLPLRDIHLPPPIGWWPPAPGWWAVAVLASVSIFILVWLIHRLRRPTLEKLALMELRRLEMDVDLPDQEKLRRLAILLRRVAISRYPREEVASLTGEAWLQWLDRPFGEPQFGSGPGHALVDAVYRHRAEIDLDALFPLCREWLWQVSKEKRA